MALLNLNLQNVQPNIGFQAVNAGWYLAKVVESEMKPTTKGGQRLNLKIELMDNGAAGRIVFYGFNLVNANPKAVEIAMGELAALGVAVNVLDLQDSSQLHNIPFKIRLIKKLNEDGSGDYVNEVRDFRPSTYVDPNAPQTMQSAPVAPAGFGQQSMQQPVQQMQQGYAQPTVQPQQTMQQSMQQPAGFGPQGFGQQQPAQMPQQTMQQPAGFGPQGFAQPVQQPVTQGGFPQQQPATFPDPNAQPVQQMQQSNPVAPWAQ